MPSGIFPARALTRRALVAAAGGAAVGCAAPWARAGGEARRVALPAPTPVRLGPLTLRLVLADEGLPALGAALRDVVANAAREAGAAAEVQDLAAYTGSGPAEAGGESVAHRLLVQVQAGVPPDALLLAGRQAQTVRFQAMGLVQDVSGLMRRGGGGGWGGGAR